MLDPPVSKRIHVTLPDSIYEALERWADKQGRPTANLGAFLIEVAVLEAQKTGEIPPDSKNSQKR
ncbi:MAG TPA: hypothetical protein V6D10_07635 [Trichocoleus sp.]|jgi:hypothetical protein